MPALRFAGQHARRPGSRSASSSRTNAVGVQGARRARPDADPRHQGQRRQGSPAPAHQRRLCAWTSPRTTWSGAPPDLDDRRVHRGRIHPAPAIPCCTWTPMSAASTGTWSRSPGSSGSARWRSMTSRPRAASTCPGSVRVHNCFILAVDDTMDSILDWYREEGLIFKGGSGAGVNLSRIRSSKELLSSGGTASGPVSFMRGADASAGTIKSGGATRRAAKMVVLDVDHPDVEEFIETKAREEEKIRVLRDAGFDMDLGGKDIVERPVPERQQLGAGLRRVHARGARTAAASAWPPARPARRSATVDAKDLFRKMAKAAWECADPGIQYDGTINGWHTCPESGRITASNPCFPADQRVATDQGPDPDRRPGGAGSGRRELRRLHQRRHVPGGSRGPGRGDGPDPYHGHAAPTRSSSCGSPTARAFAALPVTGSGRPTAAGCMRRTWPATIASCGRCSTPPEPLQIRGFRPGRWWPQHRRGHVSRLTSR